MKALENMAVKTLLCEQMRCFSMMKGVLSSPTKSLTVSLGVVLAVVRLHDERLLWGGLTLE
jgi:hypothetical protein